MKVEYCGSEFDVPELLINKFIKDFDSLPGSGDRESICMLRGSINEVFDIVAEDPEILHEKEYLEDFIQALAMRQALDAHGILYDA